MVFRKNSVNSVRAVHHAHVFTQDSVRPMSVLPTIMTMMRAVSVRKVLAQVCRVAHPSVPASVHVRADTSNVKAVINLDQIAKAAISHAHSAPLTVLHARAAITQIVKAASSHVSPAKVPMDSSAPHSVLPARAATALLPSRAVTTSLASRVVPLTEPPLHIRRKSVLPDTIPMLSIA